MGYPRFSQAAKILFLSSSFLFPNFCERPRPQMWTRPVKTGGADGP